MATNRDELKKIAEFAFNFALDRLQKQGGFHNFAHVVGEDGSINVLTAEPGEGPMEQEKNAFADAVNALIYAKGGRAVILVADSTRAEVTHPEAVQRMNRGERFTAEQCIKRGWAKREDVVTTTIETPEWWYACLQVYRRNAHGHIILGERTEDSSENPTAHMEGRFFSFFRHKKAQDATA
jgi:hypothetical protein